MKLKSATSLDNWNTSSTKLNILAQGTYDSGIYREIVPLLWQRMSEKPRYWRIVFKCLNVTEYFIRHGSQRFIEEAKEKQYQIKLLQNFHYVDSEEKDRGAAIRQKAKDLCELLDDDMRIRQLRQEAVKNADKFQALSSNGATMSSSTGAYGAGGYDTGSSNARYGGYEGETSYDSGEHPTVDYSDTASTPNDAHTTTARSKRKKDTVVAGSAHSPHAAAVNDAFDSNFDDFERDLQQATANSLEDVKPAAKASARTTKAPTPTNGDFSDHEGSDALPAKERTKAKKKKRAVVNKAVVAFGDNGLMAPPGSSSSGSKSSSKQKDLLSLEDEFGTLSTSSTTPSAAPRPTQPSTAKSQSASDDFLSFEAQPSNAHAATSSSNSSQASLFDQLASRGTATASSATAPRSPAAATHNSDIDLFSSLNASSQPSKPSHQFQQRSAAPAASPAASTFDETGDSWDSALVSLPTSQTAPAAPRSAKPTAGGFSAQPKPHATAGNSTSADALFFDVPSTSSSQQPPKTTNTDIDPFADLFNK